MQKRKETTGRLYPYKKYERLTFPTRVYLARYVDLPTEPIFPQNSAGEVALLSAVGVLHLDWLH